MSADPAPPAGGAAFPFAGRSVRVVDLSQRLSNATSAFEPMPPEIEDFDHTDTIAVAVAKFGVAAEHWREGRVWAHDPATSSATPACTATRRGGSSSAGQADRHRRTAWESHKHGAEQEYPQIEKLCIEKLCNLGALPAPTGFQVLARPIRLERASAAWARVVALVPADLQE